MKADEHRSSLSKDGRSQVFMGGFLWPGIHGNERGSLRPFGSFPSRWMLFHPVHPLHPGFPGFFFSDQDEGDAGDGLGSWLGSP
jgi:hypothetical protein